MMQLANKVSRILVALCALSFCCSTIKAQQAFVSIDCGATEGLYTDTNGVTWISDSGLDTIVGNATAVTPPRYVNTPAQFSTIRYFEGNQSKYCYVFNNKDHGVEQGSTYLVRASFWAGTALPYDTQVKNQVKFKMLINADEWDEVSITLPQTGREEMKEIYVVALKETIDVCLAGRGIGLDIPFISSLVLRPLENMTSTKLMVDHARGRPLTYMHRINYGAPSDDTYISYQADGFGDPYDRVWQPNTREPILSTTTLVRTDVADHPPMRVMQTAYQSDDSFSLTFSLQSMRSYHFALFFAEISPNVSMAGQRVFELKVLNGSAFPFGAVLLDIYNLSTHYNVYMTYSQYPVYVGIEGLINFNLIKQNGSTFGPIICGLELLQVFDHDMSLGTDDDEVTSLKSVTSILPSLKSWSGDPCLPYAYNWLSCTSDSRPRISTITLDDHGLGGEIPSGFKSFKNLVQLSLAENEFTGTIPDLHTLEYLEVLDLHGNNLSGPIPDFLAELPGLHTLILDKNNFSGEIPAKLLSKASGSGLKFSYAGNLYLCDANNNEDFCKTTKSDGGKKKSNVALVGGLAAVGAISALVAIGVLMFCVVKQKKKTPIIVKDSSQQSKIEEIHESVLPLSRIIGRSNQAQEFSYDSIKAMTQNFERLIGQGGFGPVYHGVLQNEKNVAVKLLAKDSRQGEQEFLNEVELLSRVHHKNLVSLVGYCIETQLVLVYEHMANGSLFDALKGKGANLPAWRDRLQIAVDAAEGLDYLHRGCNPSIIHRDVKSGNILLDEEFVARISDFGISKAKQYNTSTTRDSQIYTAVQGSFGYLDPAYAETNIANHSIDVYAFGIVLFELITGKPPMIQQITHSGDYQHIVQWAKPHIDRGDISSLKDPTLSDDLNLSSMWKVIDIAMVCVEHDRRRRPNMNEVKLELQSALSIEPQSNVYDTNSTDHTSFIDTTGVCPR